jgi:hypothetical protein
VPSRNAVECSYSVIHSGIGRPSVRHELCQKTNFSAIYVTLCTHLIEIALKTQVMLLLCVSYGVRCVVRPEIKSQNREYRAQSDFNELDQWTR